jgi:hypothetical protein
MDRAWVDRGLHGSKIVNRRGEGLLMDIVLGIVGAVVGGWLAGFFGLAGVSGRNSLQYCHCRRWRDCGAARLSRNSTTSLTLARW